MNYKPSYLKYLFIIPVVWFCIEGRTMGTVNEIDSLTLLIPTQEDNTDKVDNMLMLAKKYLTNNPDSAMLYCEQALKLANELAYSEGTADAIYYIGTVLKNKGELNAANEKVLRYLELCDSLKDEKRLAKGYFQYGNLFRDKRMMDSSMLYYNMSLMIYQEAKDTVRMISVINSMGNTYLEIQAYDSAASFYLKAAYYSEKVGKEKFLGIIYSNLGKVYFQIDNHEDARRYYQKSLEINKKYNNLSNLAVTYNKLGCIANYEGDLVDALKYYKESELIFEQLDNQLGIHNLYVNYAEVYRQQGKYELAIIQLDRAHKYYLDQDYTEGIIITHLNKADVLLELGRQEEALIFLDSCLDLTLSADDKFYRSRALWNYSEVLLKMGDYKRAMDYQAWHFFLEDTIFNLKEAEIIANLKLKYEKEKDQARILALENENLEKDLELSKRTNQKNIFFLTGLGVISIILFLFIFFRHKARKEKIIAEQKIRQLEEEKKVLAARTLIEGQEDERKRIAKELHDGLGVLLSATKMQFTSIKVKSPENKEMIDKATELLEQATGDVRKISHNMMPGLLTKYGLAEAVEDLFERLDETEGLNAVTEIEEHKERLPENKEIMFYRIVQELVNNTLKHAEAKNIKLKTQVLPGLLEVIYTDDGKGFAVEEKLKSRSIGLQSIQSRVNFLNGKVVIESKPGAGVKYIIHIPV